jgi:AcrR family transcriptional regulator
MQNLLSVLKVNINPKVYVKNPDTSELGRKIIEHGILLMSEIGFDNFTFKKLGERIGSNESSIYRYFENKHKLLVYLSSYYWGWIEYKLVFSTANINDPLEKLRKAIRVVTDEIQDDLSTHFINEALLNKIVISEFTKTLHTKEVDDENKEGFFLIYKGVINRLITIVQEVKPEYPFAKSLVSTVVEGALHQQFLKDHLKTITNVGPNLSATDFYTHLMLKALDK